MLLPDGFLPNSKFYLPSTFCWKKELSQPVILIMTYYKFIAFGALITLHGIPVISGAARTTDMVDS